MGQTTVRVSEVTRDLLRSLAAAEGKPMQAIVAAALEAYRRERFLGAVNRSYAVLREDPASWAGVVEERAAWEGVLLGGLPAARITPARARATGLRPTRARRRM